jgi:hypothetical protein
MANRPESKAKLDYLNIDLLDFDPSNPRFGGTMLDKSPDEIQKALTQEPYFALELVDSLLENGFIDYEPLVVKKKGDRYVVIEGNRRLAAIKEILSNPDKYAGRKEDLKIIPALIFPNKPDDEHNSEIRVYLGVRHLIGFREWPPLSKAAFLDQLSSEAGGLEKVLEELQISKSNAKRLLLPFRLLKKARTGIPRDEDFWALGEALSRKGVKEFLELDFDSTSFTIVSFNKPRLADLLNMIYGKRGSEGKRDPKTRVISDTRELSRLANVLNYEKATKVLLSGKSLAEAEIYVDTNDESKKRLQKIIKDLSVVLRKLLDKDLSTEAKNVKKAHEAFDATVKAFVKKG